MVSADSTEARRGCILSIGIRPDLQVMHIDERSVLSAQCIHASSEGTKAVRGIPIIPFNAWLELLGSLQSVLQCCQLHSGARKRRRKAVHRGIKRKNRKTSLPCWASLIEARGLDHRVHALPNHCSMPVFRTNQEARMPLV